MLPPSLLAGLLAAAVSRARAEPAPPRPLQIEMVAGLDLGEAVPGDGRLTIPPSDHRGAELLVTGMPGAAYFVLLPPLPVPLCANSHGSTGRRDILLSEFRAAPAVGALGPSGRQRVFVGATRGSISIHQAAGDYHGAFPVTVIY